MRRMMGGCGTTVTALLALILAPALATPASAQSHAEHEVHAAVEQIFEGMRTANPDLVRAVFAPDARFAGYRRSASPSTRIRRAETRWS